MKPSRTSKTISVVLAKPYPSIVGTQTIPLMDMSVGLKQGLPDPARFLTGFYGYRGKKDGLSMAHTYCDAHRGKALIVAEAVIHMDKPILLGLIKEKQVVDGETNFISVTRLASDFGSLIYEIWREHYKRRVGSQVNPLRPDTYFTLMPQIVEVLFDAYPSLAGIAYPAVTEYGTKPVQMVSFDMTRALDVSVSTFAKQVVFEVPGGLSQAAA